MCVRVDYSSYVHAYNQNYYHDCSYNVMSNCWREQPEKRPSFTELVQTLSALLVDTAADTKGFSESCS